jgi:hypothetical protein
MEKLQDGIDNVRNRTHLRPMRQTTVPTAHSQHLDDNFPDFAKHVNAVLASYRPPFFHTDASNLFAIYLTGFPLETRQTYNCHCCRRFIEQFGNLVMINEASGDVTSVLWQESSALPSEYERAVAQLREAVESSAVQGVFLSDLAGWGSSDTLDAKRKITWSHFYVPSPQRYRHALKTPFQAMAEHTEEFGMVQRGLAEFSRDVVVKAKTLLDTEQLYRGEKTLGVATWLLNLHDRIGATKNSQRRNNLIWRAIATAPAGFCHVKSTMIGTLLEDLVSGLPFETVKRRFAEKMHPLQYQRPTSLPSDGNIAQAEVIIAKLKTAGSLERRFARLEDLETLWAPKTKEVTHSAASGVFSHLKTRTKPHPEDIGGAVTLTWEKFARTVLPTAEAMEFQVPNHGAFIALVTAANSDAANILQWDNPVSWYVYNGGASASRFNLSPGWTKVNAVTTLPSTWGERPLLHQGEGAILILEGCRDTAHSVSGGFFVEQLKSEYHSIRRTLEAYMMNAAIAGKNEATACGYDLRKSGKWGHFALPTVRVTTGGVRTTYRLDRWD